MQNEEIIFPFDKNSFLISFFSLTFKCVASQECQEVQKEYFCFVVSLRKFCPPFEKALGSASRVRMTHHYKRLARKLTRLSLFSLKISHVRKTQPCLAAISPVAFFSSSSSSSSSRRSPNLNSANVAADPGGAGWTH